MTRACACTLAWLALAGCDRVAGFVYPDLAVAADLSVAGDAGGDAGPARPFLRAFNGDLFDGAARFRFVGANRYDVASFPPGSSKYQCGNAYSDDDLDRLMSELVSSTGATVIRFWAFQSFTLGGSDWSAIDRALATAARHGLRVILTLENQSAECTEPDAASPDGSKSATWYSSGYFTDPVGQYALPYRDFVRAIVTRYRDEPTVAMWQLMNEAECSDASALYDFTTDMAGVVKFIDANHLLSLGTRGTGQPGTAGAAYKELHAIAGIDVVEAHDYGDETSALPGAPSSMGSSIYADVLDAEALGKPFFIGEAGIAAPSPYPFTYDQRAEDFDAKIASQWGTGGDGYLIRSFYDLKSDNAMGWDFSPSDPLAAVLKKHAAETP